METLDCIRTRRSVRRFKAQAVPRGLLCEVVSAAAWAPSWKNSQTARYTAVESREMIERLAGECVHGYEHNANIIRGAAAVIVLSCVAGRSGYNADGSFTTSKGDRWEMFDAGIAAQTFCLAAHEKGLGTVILGVFDEHKVIEAVRLPEGQSVSALIAVGYPEGEAAAPARKTAEELLAFK